MIDGNSNKKVLPVWLAFLLSFVLTPLVIYSLLINASYEAEKPMTIIAFTLGVILNGILARISLSQNTAVVFIRRFLFLLVTAFIGLIVGFIVVLFTTEGSLKPGG